MKRLARWVLITIVGVGVMTTTSALMTPEPFGPAVAPDPRSTPEAVVQVYGADVWGVRGHFAIHTWVATKAAGASTYTIYQVIGWQLKRRGTVLSITEGAPDRPWFRSPPVLLHERRGEGVQALVEAVRAAALDYPYQGEYTMWPGPNSNSFTAWIALSVPELGMELPFKALGQSWMQDNFPH